MVAPPSLAVLLPGIGSGGPLAEISAVFVGLPDETIVVSMVIGPSGTFAPGPLPVVRVHSRIWPVTVHIQPGAVTSARSKA